MTRRQLTLVVYERVVRETGNAKEITVQRERAGVELSNFPDI